MEAKSGGKYVWFGEQLHKTKKRPTDPKLVAKPAPIPVSTEQSRKALPFLKKAVNSVM